MPISETLVFSLLQLLLSSLAATRAHIFNLRAITSVLFKKKCYIILSLMKVLLVRRKTDLQTGAFPTTFFFFGRVSPAQRKLFCKVRFQFLVRPARILCLCSASVLKTLFLYRELTLKNLILGKARRGPNSSEATADCSKGRV